MSEDEYKEIKINDYKVFYKEETRAGITFLKEVLSRAEAEVFFYYSKNRGKCPFQAMFRDGYVINLTLEYDYSKYAFYIVYRQADY